MKAWADNDQKTPVPKRLARGLRWFAEATGAPATHALVSERDVTQDLSWPENVTVVPSPHIAKGMFYLWTVGDPDGPVA